jgi:hypothetical protein
MHDEVRVAMRAMLARASDALQPQVCHFTEPFFVWRKQGDGWMGTFEDRPSLTMIFLAAKPELGGSDAQFLKAFRVHHPQYDGMLSFQTVGGGNFLLHPGFILHQAMNRLWLRHGTFQPEAGDVEALIQEFADIVDGAVVRFRFRAQLLNYQMESQSIPLPDGVVIRRLSEQEVSDIYAGPLWQLGIIRQSSRRPHEFAIEGEYDDQMVFGELAADPKSLDQVRRRLDKAITALRTFKEGRVGYDEVRFESVKFWPTFSPSLSYGDVYVPPGHYAVSKAEVETLLQHAELVFACSDLSMQMACARLADAENRTRTEDRIVDAVVGMESILLAAIDKQDRRGEQSFRFAMNYSTLFEAPESKLRAYKVARDLYGLRSVVAHGSAIDEDKLKIAGEKMTLDAAGRTATEVLREIVKFFLAEKRALHKNAEFWQRRYFGLPNA